MINHFGLKPTSHDHRDYDYFKTHHPGGVGTPVFPDNYSVDAGLWMPSQNENEPIFGNPPLYFGCTEYAASDACADQDGILYNPMYLENILHASANMGADLRQVLLATIKYGTQTKNGAIAKRALMFNIKAYAPLDFFDAIRYAILAGGTEKRCAILGTPWYKSFQTNTITDGITCAPVSYDTTDTGWHAWNIKGWKNINGITYLECKSWQGDKIGDKGWLYFDRATINAMMTVNGTCAFTVTSMGTDQPIARVASTVWEWLYSFTRNMIGLRY